MKCSVFYEICRQFTNKVYKADKADEGDEAAEAHRGTERRQITLLFLAVSPLNIAGPTEDAIMFPVTVLVKHPDIIMRQQEIIVWGDRMHSVSQCGNDDGRQYSMLGIIVK